MFRNRRKPEEFRDELSRLWDDNKSDMENVVHLTLYQVEKGLMEEIKNG